MHAFRTKLMRAGTRGAMEPSDYRESPSSFTTDGEAIVPNVLLALAKDRRYLEHVSQLLRAAVGGGDGGAVTSSQLLSSALYALLVLHRRRRSLGQEALGLGYNDGEADASALRRWRLPAVWIAASTTVYLLRRLVGEDITSVANHGNINETLRGTQRRAIFEQQRHRMTMRNATANGGEAPQPSDQTALTSVDAEPVLQPWRRCARDTGQRIAVSLASGLLATDTNGPHVAASGRIGNMSRSFCAWVVRLHWAFYCLDGTYPTWMHRVFQLRQHQRESNNTQLFRQPQRTIYTIGRLILVQAVAALVPCVLIRLVYRWDDTFTLPSFLPPAVQFGDEDPVMAAGAEDDGRPVHCTICQRTRRLPACSVRCGHVFCWACLQQWVRSYEACPMCRLQCRPQDVLALRSYAPLDSPTGSDDYS